MIFDFHNDVLTDTDEADYKREVEAANGKVFAMTEVIWTTEFSQTLTQIDTLVTRSLNVDKDYITTFAIEDLGFIFNENDLYSLDFSRFFYCSLTWNFDNALAGGACGNGDLTPLGKKAIDFMQGKTVVDVSHLNRRSFWRVADCAQDIVASHTFIGNDARNIDDAQVREIIAHKGVIGLFFVSKFTKASSCDTLCGRILDLISKYGADVFCIGSDLHGSDDIPKELSDYSFEDVMRESLENYLTSDIIDKLFYENLLNYYKEHI